MLDTKQPDGFLHWRSAVQTVCSAGYLCTLCMICLLSMYVYARPLAYGHHFAVRAHHYLTVCFCVFWK